MGSYLLRRLGWGAIVLVGVSIVVFVLVRVVPGDPVALMLPDPQAAPPDVIQATRVQFGLDRPLYEQYGIFLARIVVGNLGESYRYRQPATNLVLQALPNTLQLTVCALVFSALFGGLAGVVAAVRHNSLIDRVVMLLAVLGQSAPTFWLGIILIIVFAVTLRLVPTSGYGSWQHLVLPTITLSGFLTALVARLVRSSLLDVLGQDFVRTARAKGIAESAVVARHALRNALIPVVTVLGLQISTLLGGAVITEAVFAWPGIGTLAVNAIAARDYNVIQAVVLLSAAIFVVVNLGVDVLYTWLDPRIRLAG